MSCKSAAAILQEFMIKKQSIPQYDFLPQTEKDVFHCQAQGLGVSYMGTGRSKKEAKQIAARGLLERFADMGIYFPKGKDPLLEESSPVKKEVMESVVKIKDLCSTYNIPLPEYVLIDDSGKPHCKMFTIECHLGALTFSATSTTKKLARQLAASKLLDYMHANLNAIIEEFEEMTNTSATEIAKQRYIELQDMDWKPNLGLSISDFHLALNREKSDAVKEKALNLIENSGDGDILQLTERVLNELDLKSTFKFFPTKKKEIVCMLSIDNTTPQLCFSSTPQHCENQAKMIAAKETLDGLQVLLK